MRERAFTIFEVLLTIFVLGLIVAFMFADYGQVSASRSLEESSHRLRTLILRAQAEAMQSGMRYRISFPGTPDPLDPTRRDDLVDMPVKTEQPIIERQADPINAPDAFTGDFAADWKDTPILQQGTRCVAVLPGRPTFDINTSSPIAGPSFVVCVTAGKISSPRVRTGARSQCPRHATSMAPGFSSSSRCANGRPTPLAPSTAHLLRGQPLAY